MTTDSLRAGAVTGGDRTPPVPPRPVELPIELPVEPAIEPPVRHSALRRMCGLDRAEFAERFWGRRPLVVEAADASGFSDLLDLAGVDELLSRRGLRTPFVRLARDGSVIGSAAFTAPGGVGAGIGDQVRDDKVADLFAGGATIVLQALHRTWSPIIDFTAGLGAELGHPVQVNAYVTPPDGKGFGAHYDVHDVFVLQLAGTKQWTVHAPVHADPLGSQPWTDHADAVAARARDRPTLTAELRPGDVMYLPRGWLHSATAGNEVSAHLTVGVHVVTRYLLVEGLVAALAADPRLRAPLPPGLDLTDPEQLAPHLAVARDIVRETVGEVDAEVVAARVRRHVWEGGRLEPVRPVAAAQFARRLGPGDAVRLRYGLGHRLTGPGRHGSVVLELPDRRIALPATTAAAVRTLLTRDVCVVGELPGIDVADQVVLVRRLVREGVVVPASGA